MKSGRQTLHEIDNAVAEARANLDRTSDLASRMAEERAALRRRRLEAIAVIASERMAVLESGEAAAPRDRDLRRADQEAQLLLERYAAEITDLRSRSKATQAELERLEAERSELEKEVDEAVEAFESAAAAVQARLMGEDTYQAALSRVEEAEATVDRAERKRLLAAEDEAEKGKPYRADRLFSYLWDRQYGTKDYRGGLITKMLDDWVAGLCDYRDVALNYKRLTEIPVRLAEHVANLEQTAEAERTALTSVEEEALEADGATRLREASIAKQSRLDELDAQIIQTEDAHKSALDEQSATEGSSDSAYGRALNILSEALADEDLSDLRWLAAQTDSLEDDDAVAELIALEDEADDLEDDEEDARDLIKKYRRSLEELERVRRRFKEARYDSPSSGFPTGELIGSMLGQIIVGALTSEELWDFIRRGQRTIARKADFDFDFDFGDDWMEGFRMPRGRPGRSRGGWTTRPSRKPRKRSGRGSRNRTSRGGGFRTGGGF